MKIKTWEQNRKNCPARRKYGSFTVRCRNGLVEYVEQRIALSCFGIILRNKKHQRSQWGDYKPLIGRSVAMKRYIALIIFMMICMSCANVQLKPDTVIKTDLTCDPDQKFCYESKYSPLDIMKWNKLEDETTQISRTRIVLAFKHPTKLTYAMVALEYPGVIMNYTIFENGKVSFYKIHIDINTYKLRPLNKEEDEAFQGYFKDIMKVKGLEA